MFTLFFLHLLRQQMSLAIKQLQEPM